MSDTDIAELWGGALERSYDQTTWSRVALVKSVAPPELSKNYRDRTTLDTVGKVKEYGGGFADPGDISIECIYTSAGYQAALADQAADFVWYRATLSNGDVFIFKSTVTVSAGDLDVQSDSDATFTISGRTSGEAEFTAGA